jgi:hypothetical protein
METNNQLCYYIQIYKFLYGSKFYVDNGDKRILEFIHNSYSYVSFEDTEKNLLWWIKELEEEGEFKEREETNKIND